MNAQPTLLGTRADGSLIGELDGKLYTGVRKQVGFDQIEREIEQKDGAYECSYHVGGSYVGGETLTTEPGEHKPEKSYEDIYIREQDGSLTKGRQEVTLPIIDWSAL